MRVIQATLALAALVVALPVAADAQLLARATRMTIACQSNAELVSLARLRREGRADLAEAQEQRALASASCRAVPAGEHLTVWNLQRDRSFGDLYVHRRGAGERASIYVRAADFELVEP